MFLLKIPVIFCIFLLPSMAYSDSYPPLTEGEITWIGEKVFANECNSDPECLTSWNEGEEFPSLGIGHFIWYRADQAEIYQESFPELLTFFEAQGVAVPAWLHEENYDSPWQDREAFLADFNSDRLRELRLFLNSHTGEQAEFIIERFNDALSAILDSLDTGTSAETLKTRVEENFYRVANSSPPRGLYALIDYVNFKGTGTASGENYLGQGWGLKQVLLGMEQDGEPLLAFVRSAREILKARISNAPPERNESRWLNGWYNRLDTYLPGNAGINSR